MTTLTPFTYEGQQVRVVERDGEPWFVLADLCRVLDLSNPTMVAERIDADALSTAEVIDSMGRVQQARIVSEPGMYQAAFMSRKPEAATFRRWVTHEVLPAIRKTGAYATPSVPRPDLSELSPRNLAYLSELAKGLEAAVKHAEKNQRKADGYDQFLNGSGCYLVDTAANLLGIGHRRLWTWLYTSKLLIPHGPRKRQPYANPKTTSWFVVKTYDTDRTNGKARATTYITPVGLEAIRLRLVREGIIQSTLFALPNPVRGELA